MARITHVKSAQQRFKTVPVLNEDGTPKRVPVLRKNGEQRKTKRGKPVTMAVTRQDKTQPLPPERCDFPGCQIDGGKIMPGTPYKWVKPKSGPYGGRKRSRHAEHPSWNPWDLSNALWARIQQVTSEAEDALSSAEDEEGLKSAMEDAANGIRDLAEEKREAAQNIVDGFGHDTEQSQDLEQQAEDLDAWADDLESWEPDDSQPESCETCNGAGTETCPAGCHDGQVDCNDCDGSGEALKGAGPCETCDGTGQVVCDDCDGEGTVTCEDCDGSGDPSEEDVQEWLENAAQSALDALGESPL